MVRAVRLVTTWIRGGLMTSSVLVACSFSVSPSQPAGDGAIADAPIDAVVPDGGACAAASAECVAGTDVLRTCSGPGADSVDEPCAWGCVPGPARCAALAPAGGAVTGADLMGMMDRSIDVASVINGSTRMIGGAAWSDSRLDLANVAVFQFRNLTINAAVQLGGSHGIALVASGDVTINNVIDGRPPGCPQPGAGPGGFVGGDVSMNGTGAGGGSGGIADFQGGGGGGHGGAGGSGGASMNNEPPGGGSTGTPTIAVLVGGSGGGGGGDGGGPVGGGGGAALQIVAAGTITINSTGGINAGGCGGKNAGNNDSGAGGGAGGTILLEGRQVVINAAARLAVNGGGGGGGAGGGTGEAGRLDRTAAAGGIGTATGGTGGAGASLNGAPGVFNGTRGGGGGGAVGRIRINTRTGSAAIDGAAVLSPALADNPTTATQGVVNLQ